jgi:hypothetical protein
VGWGSFSQTVFQRYWLVPERLPLLDVRLPFRGLPALERAGWAAGATTGVAGAVPAEVAYRDLTWVKTDDDP